MGTGRGDYFPALAGDEHWGVEFMFYALSSKITNIEQLDRVLTTPSAAVVEAMHTLQGDLLILGAGGKMGATLAILAKRAIKEADLQTNVICVSRFSNKEARKTLEDAGIETIACNLLDEAALQKLPEAENIIYMAGMKFGSSGNQAATWTINTFLPGLIARRFKKSRIVLFSTGNVYPLVPIDSGGSKENDAVSPIGEYGQSALGRERVFEYFSREYDFPGVIFRLNYAIDLRYGVLLDIAQKVFLQQPIDLRTGFVNVIWQGDANAIALRCLAHAETPPLVLNVTGRETLSVRKLAERFGEMFGKSPLFNGRERDSAFLSDAGLCRMIFGEPRIKIEQMVRWVAHWVEIEGSILAKPTKFEVRSGAF